MRCRYFVQLVVDDWVATDVTDEPQCMTKGSDLVEVNAVNVAESWVMVCEGRCHVKRTLLPRILRYAACMFSKSDG